MFDDENEAHEGKWAYPDTGVWDADRNVAELIAALPSYKASGLDMITVGMQGGMPGGGVNGPNITTAFEPDGTLKPAWIDRLHRLLAAADQNGIIVEVSLFYLWQEDRMIDEDAVKRGVDNIVDWLVASGYKNVLLEIVNESADDHFLHPILRPGRVHELIESAQQRSAGQLLVATSFRGGVMPPPSVLAIEDFILLHGNKQTPTQLQTLIEQVKNSPEYIARPRPIVVNEDSTSIANMDVAIGEHVSWGYYDQGANDYVHGFQSVPVNWTVNTPEKKNFFSRVAFYTESDPVAPAPSPSESPSPSPVESPSPTPEEPPTPSPTPEEPPSPTPEEPPTPSPTPVESPTPAESPTPTPTPVESPSPTPDESPTPAESPSPSPEPTPSQAPPTVPAGQVVYRVNAGGSAVAGWTADTTSSPSRHVNAAATGNRTYRTWAAIDLSHPSLPDGIPGALFQDERWDPKGGADMQWTFAVTPGTYEVRLYFAEIYSGAQKVGARLFDVSVEGDVVLDNYDVFAEVGANAGVMKSIVTTTDANIDIKFGPHVVENPMIKAIEIVTAD
ncbi:MAG: malectin domain-containing carbohydrate-binding protein [Actinomycetota bacterium]